MSADDDDLVKEAFRKAQLHFRDSLPDRNLYNEIRTETTAEDVYDLLKKIQEDAASRGDMRYMAKIRPFIERLKEYGPTLDVFCSAKSDVLALIWGPMRFIIQWASQFYKILDSIADATIRIATALPHFASVMQIFPRSDTIKLALVLFYENILDFYAAILKYHKKRGWERAIEAAWPRVARKIEVITKNIDENTQRMTTEVTFLDIEEAHKARIQALEHFEATHTFQETQKFLGLKARIGPVLYDERLDSLRNMPDLEEAEWLTKDRAFIDWLDVSKRDCAWLWMEGKPGAGKTFIAAAAIDYAKQIHPTLFIFANQMNEEKLTALSSIQSLIFQAAIDDEGLQAAVVESNERDLRSDTSQTSHLLKSLINSAGPTYIVIDGLNEIEENERRILMAKLDDIVKDCKELKILICSQSHHDISTALANKAERISVHQKNFGTIERYIRKDHESG